MSEEIHELGKRIEICIDLVGGINYLTSLTGIAKSTIYSWKRGEMEPKVLAMKAIGRAAGVSMDWLITGEGPMRLDEEMQLPNHAEGSFIKISQYDAVLSAGAGAFNDRVQKIGEIPFTVDFLKKKLGRNSTKDLIIVEVKGDSMDPTIGDGDIVIIDRSIRRFDAGIAAIVFEDDAYIKRIQRIFNKTKIISDNPQYESISISNDEVSRLYIIGKVLWAGRSF